MQTAITISMWVMAVFSVCNTLFWQHLLQTPTHAIMLSYIILSVLAMYYFWYMLQFPSSQNILKNEIFWFNSALLIYCSISFFTLSTYNFHLETGIDNSVINAINAYVNLFFYAVLNLCILSNAFRASKH